MSQQALDLRGSLQIVRRYRSIVSFAAALGLVAGAVYTALYPPMLASKALVSLPPTVTSISGEPPRLADSGCNRDQRPRPGAGDATC